MRKKTSLKDIATQLGVSTALVSYVLNNKFSGRINVDTAKKIKELAQSLNYRPNHVAKSLKKDKTFTIGLIIADISNLFYSSVTRFIEDESRKHKYHVIFGSADENAERFRALIDVFVSRQVDGIILAAPAGAESDLEILHAQRIPFVLIDRFFPALQHISSVMLNNYKASAEVVEHLFERGYRHPVMITLATDLFHLKERSKGFRETAKHLLKLDEPPVIEVNEECMHEDIQGILSTMLKEKDVDALYLSTNKIAIEVLSVLAHLKVKVPEELAVVCFDEADAYRIFNTSITYVKQPLKRIGSEAVDILISQINGEQQGNSVVLDSIVVDGDSTASRSAKS